jgi:probable HAF family extracellular repeat protein
MKTKKLTCLMVLAAFATLAIPDRLVTQEQKGSHSTHQHYRLIDLGTFGGITSYVNPVGNGGPYMNREGMVVGSSMTSIPIPANQNGYPCPSPPNEVFHAMEWSSVGVSDLGSLGAARNCGNALAINDSGEIVGTSENGRLDPATGVIQIRAVLWKDSEVKNLGTFGGNHSFASSINSRGQIVGFALDPIPDPFSLFDFGIGGLTSGTQTRAFLWENGHLRDLDTLGGPDAWALFVNERGQVAGYSYINGTPNPSTKVPTQDPFLWTEERGMVDLGSLGGTSGFPVGLNNRGQVIGVSNLAGDQITDPFLWDGEKLIDLYTDTIGGNPISANALSDSGEIVGGGAFPNRVFDAYLWRRGIATDLGTLPGDCFSQAFVMNSRGQIAGNSATCDVKLIRAVLWEDGKVFDLNTLIPRNSSLLLVESNAINDRGEIAGNGFPPGCTDFSCTHAFVLIPCGEDEMDSRGCRNDDDAEGNAVSQSSGASMSEAQTTAAQANLTPSEMKDRVRGILTNRNRRFRGFPPK